MWLIKLSDWANNIVKQFVIGQMMWYCEKCVEQIIDYVMEQVIDYRLCDEQM